MEKTVADLLIRAEERVRYAADSVARKLAIVLNVDPLLRHDLSTALVGPVIERWGKAQ